MKTRFLTSFIIAVACCISCDDNTNDIGSSLTDNVDQLQISTDTFAISTRSIKAGAVLSRSTNGYIGRILDPETGAYITGDFITQFQSLENYEFPHIDSLVTKKNNIAFADSCEIRLYYDSFYGDTLTTMKLTAYEMGTPMSESLNYYSDFDPIADNYIRKEGIVVDKLYTLTDLNTSLDVRNDDDFTPNIRIKLDRPYTDKEGNVYSNFGSYIMQKYYEDPSNFKNSYTFIHNLVPGFYFKTKSGLGAMANIYISQLNVFFRYLNNGESSIGYASFVGTEEVLQSTRISNDETSLQELLNDNTCTYLKTPAGIFTEMTLPVDEILKGHENDTINAAKVVLTRINNKITSDYSLHAPQTLLMIPADEMQSFFEDNKIADYKTSFLASLNSTLNTYTFSNIGSLIKHMHRHRDPNNANWNKVVIIPVSASYNTSNQLIKVSHDMSMTSTRLIGGSENAYQPLKISVIYSKFK
ncbi:MAG: DUF4270 domain-containing protein [Prevotella sp.]